MNKTCPAKNLLVFTVLFIALLFATYLSNTALIYIDMDSTIDSEIQVFWTESSQPYTENKSTILPVTTGRHDYWFFLHKFTKASRIRIDPVSEKASLKFFSINVFSSQYNPVKVNHASNILHENNLSLPYPPNQKQDYIQANATGIDPYFEITSILIRHNITLYIFILGVLLLLVSALRRGNVFTVTQILWLCVVILSFQLAWQSQHNIHPDESAHAESIKYYQTYWDPPTVGDPRAQNAYQAPWAISRLDNVGISYFFSGKFMSLVQHICPDEVFNTRALNLLMLTGLFFWSNNRKLLLFFLPLLCTPQIWYLFSYANRGGFALFISLLLAWQLANTNSLLHIFLRSKKVTDNWRAVLFPSLLLGILSIEQTNYFIFILFTAALLLWDLVFSITQKKIFIYKCLLFIFIGFSIFIARHALDIAINGFNKYEQQVAYAEKYAEPAFKPSVAGTEQGYSGLRLRQKGIGFTELFKPDLNWHRMTFKSFTGLYGYYAQESPRWYYRCTLVLHAIILLSILMGTVRANILEAYSLTAIAFIFIMGGCLISFLYSWLYDFQPQGRYIFPIIPILLVYLWRAYPLWKRTEKRVMLSCSLCLILLSIYSFSTVALNHISS